MRFSLKLTMVGFLSWIALACTKQNLDHGPPTICQAVKESTLVVQGQVTNVGSSTTAQQAGLPLGATVDANWTGSGAVTSVTIDVTATLVGTPPGSSLTFFLGGSGGYTSGSGSNYFLLALDGKFWVAVAIFHADSTTGLLTDDNGYRGSQEISQSDFLSQVNAAQQADPLCGGCVAGTNCPVLCKQGYEGCQLICDPTNATPCPAGQQCQPCPTGGSICYKVCAPVDAGSCPEGERCAVSNQGGYVCSASLAADGG